MNPAWHVNQAFEFVAIEVVLEFSFRVIIKHNTVMLVLSLVTDSVAMTILEVGTVDQEMADHKLVIVVQVFEVDTVATCTRVGTKVGDTIIVSQVVKSVKHIADLERVISVVVVVVSIGLVSVIAVEVNIDPCTAKLELVATLETTLTITQKTPVA